MRFFNKLTDLLLFIVIAGMAVYTLCDWAYYYFIILSIYPASSWEDVVLWWILAIMWVKIINREK
jgi:hypothetical protein